MSFGYTAVGRKDDVIKQLAFIAGSDSLAGEIAELISRHLASSTEHVYGDEAGTERVTGYIVEASGHSGHGSQPSLTVSLKPVYLVIVPAEADANEGVIDAD